MKNDEGKTQWHLLPFEPLEEVAKVFEYGKKKYGEGNYRKVDNFGVRYFNATMRHLLAWKNGEILDKESGLLFC